MKTSSLTKIGILFFVIFLIIIFLFMFVKNYKKTKSSGAILFLGDSITERYKLDKYLFNYNTINSGIGGNTTNDILNDIDKRVNNYSFDKVFILIGINDLLFTEETNEEIVTNIEKIIDSIDNKRAVIYLESIYPVNTDKVTDIPKDSNTKINEMNKLLENICNKGKCNYINMHDKLTDKQGNLKKLYTNDGIHISKIGYIKVTKELLNYMK